MTTTPKALPALPECYVISGGRELFSAEQMHAYAQQAIADYLASAGGVEVVAYLVSGGRIFKDQAVTHKDSARTRIAERKDGSVAHPLVKQSDYLAALSKEREVADGLAEALRAYQEAEAMSVYGDYSGFVWGKQTMRSEGNHAYGYICDRHGLGYTSSCVCCRDEYERYENQQDLKARIARDEAFRRARLAAGHALAALTAHRESRGENT